MNHQRACSFTRTGRSTVKRCPKANTTSLIRCSAPKPTRSMDCDTFCFERERHIAMEVILEIHWFIFRIYCFLVLCVYRLQRRQADANPELRAGRHARQSFVAWMRQNGEQASSVSQTEPAAFRRRPHAVGCDSKADQPARAVTRYIFNLNILLYKNLKHIQIILPFFF